MGRVLKRVPLDFDWPLKKVWNGYCDYKRIVEPPRGDGFQLWETTTEGSPRSPVFKTLDELCEWCEGNGTVFASIRTTKEEWKEMLSGGFVCIKQENMMIV